MPRGLRHRQVSLLAAESIEKMAAGALASPGDFAENITTEVSTWAN
jgi:hypothetical protein